MYFSSNVCNKHKTMKTSCKTKYNCYQGVTSSMHSDVSLLEFRILSIFHGESMEKENIVNFIDFKML